MSRLFQHLDRLAHQRPWLLLGALTVAFTLLLTNLTPWQAAGWMQASPPATPTPMPPQPSPSPTIPQPTPPPPSPTATPQQPPTATPQQPPVVTPTTIVIPPTSAPASPLPPTPSAPPPTQANPLLPPGVTPPATISPAPSPAQPGATPTPNANPENLVKLIDTFVLYGAYFLLGLGAILVITLAVFFYYLNRRSRELRDGSQPPEQPR